MRPALENSWENIFHEVGVGNFLLPFDHGHDLAWALDQPRLEHAIDGHLRPETERQSHYFNASMSRRVDAMLHFNVTRAVEPLERSAAWDRGDELPEAYPTGL